MDKLSEILRAAGELIAQKGFEETSVQEIANLAGVAAGTVIYHFKSKHNLLFILTRQIQYRILNRAREAVARAADPKDEILRLVGAYFDHGKDHPSDMMVIQKSDPALLIDMSSFPYKDYSVILEQYKALYADAMRRGVAVGLFPPLPVDKLCTVIVSMLHGIWRLACYGQDVLQYREEILGLVDRRLTEN